MTEKKKQKKNSELEKLANTDYKPKKTRSKDKRYSELVVKDISKLSLDEILELHRKEVETKDKLKNIASEKGKDNAFILSKKQEIALKYLTDNKTTHIGYGGGAGGAKTVIGVFWIIQQALKYDETAWVIGRKSFTSLRATTLKSFMEVLKMLNIPISAYKYNQQSQEITFQNGSIVMFKNLGYKPSDPEYTELGGLEITGAFVDESNEVEPKAIEILYSRIGRKNNIKHGLLGKILEAFNPDKNHVYTRYYEPFKKRKLPQDTIFIPALTIDNPYISENYIRNIWSLSEISKQRLLFGNFDYDDSADSLLDHNDIISTFDRVIEDDDERYLIVDVADEGDDLTVLGYFRGLELYDIDVYSKKDPYEVAEIIRTSAANRNIPMSNIAIDAIGIGAGVISNPLLKGAYGFKSSYGALAVDRTQRITRDGYGGMEVIDDYVKANYNNLRSQCGFELANVVKTGKFSIRVKDEYLTFNGKSFYVRERIANELAQLRDEAPDKHENNKMLISKSKMKKNLGSSPDFLDVLIMRMYFYLIKDFENTTIKKKKLPLHKRKFMKTTVSYNINI